MTNIFLGKPPANIEAWIKEHAAPAGHAETWYKYAGDTEWKTVSIKGSIEGSLDDDTSDYIPTTQIPDVILVAELEIGTDVTSIGKWAFYYCTGLTNITIGENVTSIEQNVFGDCNLKSLTFLGKTLEQVQNIEDEYGYKHYPWGIADTSIINVA